MNIAINGFGRIGRVLHRIISSRKGLNLVAVNDINPDINNLAYLANYDSTYGPLANKYSTDGNKLVAANSSIDFFSEKDIADVPWEDMNIDVLIDSSGIAQNLISAKQLKGKVKQVIFTNSPDESSVDKTVIFGVNHKDIILSEDFLISSSICDATAFAPLVKLIHDNFTVENGFLTTLHPWLGYQNLLDGPSKAYAAPGEIHDEYALGRSSLMNLIPKNTSAISATYKVLPELKDKFMAVSYRIPTSIVSSADSTLILKNSVSKEDITSLLIENEKELPDIISNNFEALVSSDFTQNTSSVIVDHRFLKSEGNFLKLLTWYDNEWGYSSRVVDLVEYLIQENNN